jgi:hypothetical protein
VDPLVNRPIGSRACHLSLTPSTRWYSVVALERRCEGVGRGVADAGADLPERQVAGAQVISCQRHAPFGQVLLGRLTESELEDPSERRT